MPRLSLAKLERHLYSAADRLRQEGLDAATYKDYIFGMLFLKRCSDVFDAEHAVIVGAKVEQGMELKQAEKAYGENPDYYDGFFVPERARWNHLQDKLNDASVPYGSVLDTALGALSEANESLEHVLDHISFLKTQGTKRLVSDDCCKDLVRHFTMHRLRNEDFQFSDLLGSAYEFLINMFAESAGKKRDAKYYDFAPVLSDVPAEASAKEPAKAGRAAIRPLIENDPGVQACLVAVRQHLAAWWQKHAPRLADLPRSRALNRVRSEFLESFVAAMLANGGPGGSPLDRFKLAGVIATWWTDTLPDFKTLLENGFPGVMDGWVDAIADAVEDDDNAGPAFDPFSHKLVRRTMTDYLERIAAAKADIGRFKGEKEAFEQSDAPDELDEDELAAWNYAKDLDRQMRELKAENKNALKELAKLERAAASSRGSAEASAKADAARQALQSVLDQLAALEAALQPYETIKEQLAEARARYRTLTAEFVDELKSRCDVLNADQKRALVLELFAQDVQTGLDAAVADKRQELVRFIEGLWDKYRVTLHEVRNQRADLDNQLAAIFQRLRYA